MMQLRTRAAFADPGDMTIHITLSGPLSGFEELAKALGGVPYYQVDNLLTQISDVSWKLRGAVEADRTPPRAMLPGDLGFLWSAQELRK